jgi:uncharacterized protein YndB with AHSA1/START domain
MEPRDRHVRESLHVHAELAHVWRAWTDPSWLTGWLVERTRGALAAGGRIAWAWPSLGVEVELEVVACEPPARLVLRSASPLRPAQTQSVALAPVAGGGTRVELVHTGFPLGPAGDDERAGTAAGWKVALRVLAHHLAGGGERRRACAAVLAPLAVPLSAAGRLLFDPEGRAGWLSTGAGPALGGEGERFALQIPGGALVTGRVLATAPPYQLALTWDEVDGVLILRAIQVAGGAGGAVLAGLQAWSWSPERAAWRAARGALEHAVGRLTRAAGGGAAGSAGDTLRR